MVWQGVGEAVLGVQQLATLSVVQLQHQHAFLQQNGLFNKLLKGMAARLSALLLCCSALTDRLCSIHLTALSHSRPHLLLSHCMAWHGLAWYVCMSRSG